MKMLNTNKNIFYIIFYFIFIQIVIFCLSEDSIYAQIKTLDASLILGNWSYPGGDVYASVISIRKNKTFTFTGLRSPNFKSHGTWKFEANTQKLTLEFADNIKYWNKVGGKRRVFKVLNDMEIHSRFGNKCRFLFDFGGFFFDKYFCTATATKRQDITLRTGVYNAGSRYIFIARKGNRICYEGISVPSGRYAVAVGETTGSVSQKGDKFIIDGWRKYGTTLALHQKGRNLVVTSKDDFSQEYEFYVSIEVWGGESKSLNQCLNSHGVFFKTAPGYTINR